MEELINDFSNINKDDNIQKIEIINSDNEIKDEDFNNHISILKSKLKKNYNCSISSIDVKFKTKTNRFLIAGQDYEEEDTLIEIPFMNLLHVENSIVKKIIMKAKIPKLSSHYNILNNQPACLAIFILYQMKKPTNNFFKSYIGSLPSNYNEYPLYWDKEELEIFKGTGFYEDNVGGVNVDEIIDLLKSSKNNFFDIDYTKDDVKYAFMSVNSRNFYVKFTNEEKKGYHVLAPFIDLFNHSTTPNLDWAKTISFDDDTFKITAVKKIQKGEEITIGYGHSDNFYFLNNYGFYIKELDSLQNVEVEVDFIIINYDSNVITNSNSNINTNVDSNINTNTQQDKNINIVNEKVKPNYYCINSYEFFKLIKIVDDIRLKIIKEKKLFDLENKSKKLNLSEMTTKIEREVYIFQFIKKVLMDYYLHDKSLLESLLKVIKFKENEENKIINNNLTNSDIEFNEREKKMIILYEKDSFKIKSVYHALLAEIYCIECNIKASDIFIKILEQFSEIIKKDGSNMKNSINIWKTDKKSDDLQPYFDKYYTYFYNVSDLTDFMMIQ